MTDRRTGTDTQKRWDFRTRCYYSTYVYHMIRFYLSTPETLQMEGKRKADIDNWIAVQDVWHRLGAEDRETIETVFKLHHSIQEAIKLYCQQTGTDLYKVGTLVTKTCSNIAKRRGLI